MSSIHELPGLIPSMERGRKMERKREEERLKLKGV